MWKHIRQKGVNIIDEKKKEALAIFDDSNFSLAIGKKGNNVKVIYNGSRNKKEEYEGIIKEVYNYIFIIKTDGNEVKSFSYRDVLTNTIDLYG